jgi:hypothetical protein
LLAERAPERQVLERRMNDALQGAGLNPAAFSRGVEHLASALHVSTPLSLQDLAGTPLARVVERYLVHHDAGSSLAIYCYPSAGEWRRQAPPELVEVLEDVPGASVTGTNVVSAELRRIVWGDAARAAAIGIVVVFALMWADLGGPLRALLALLPLSLGLLWMLGLMALVGVRINFMNIFVLTMVIGIGVDYGVHLLHRFYESGGHVEAVAGTARAVAVAAVTTVVGFGSLVLSHFPGLRSMGIAAILGALCTAIASITVLPVALSRRALGPDRDSVYRRE